MTSVVLDRVAALVAVATLILLPAPIFLYRVGISLPMLVPIFVSMVGFVGLLLAAQFERLPEGWLRFRPLRLLHDLGGSIRAVFLRPASVLPLLGVAILRPNRPGNAAYTMAVSLNLNVSLLDCVVLMQPVALVANLPISVGGWGLPRNRDDRAVRPDRPAGKRNLGLVNSAGFAVPGRCLAGRPAMARAEIQRTGPFSHPVLGLQKWMKGAGCPSCEASPGAVIPWLSGDLKNGADRWLFSFRVGFARTALAPVHVIWWRLKVPRRQPFMLAMLLLSLGVCGFAALYAAALFPAELSLPRILLAFLLYGSGGVVYLILSVRWKRTAPRSR